MGSNLLPQAVISMPRTATPYSSKKLGFYTTSPSSLSSFSSNRITLSSVSSAGFNSTIAPIAVPWVKRCFVVKAESNSEGENGTSANAEVPDVETEPETGAESEAEEAKPPTPRKPRIKLGEIMGILNKRAIEASEKERAVPEIRTGDIVEIKLEVPENRRRASIYKGIVISRQNAGVHTTIRIRRIIAGIGVEIVFPLYSPNIKEIKVIGRRKVRRARLYYLRDKLPRLSTFK